MFGSIGIFELILILVIVLLLFGAKKLPELGKASGETLRSFRKGLTGKDDDSDSDKEQKTK